MVYPMWWTRVAYIFQGKIFAHLRSTVPQPLKPEFFQSSFVMTYDGRWFSKYPPGYPLMLVPALWAGVPGWSMLSVAASPWP